MSEVFQHDSLGSYFHSVYTRKKFSNPKFSLRAFAKKLNLNHPTNLSRIFENKTKVSDEVIRKISQIEVLSESEQSYLKYLKSLSLIPHEPHRKNFADYVNDELDVISPSKLEDIKFNVIANWYYFAILELTQVKGFQSNVTYIEKKLFPKIPMDRIVEAVGNLIKLKLLTIDKKGNWVRNVQGRLHIGDDEKSISSIKTHQTQMMDLAKNALLLQDVNERDFRSLTISINHEDIEKVKGMFKKFQEKLSKFSSSSGTELYQFNTQFFKLTTRDSQ